MESFRKERLDDLWDAINKNVKPPGKNDEVKGDEKAASQDISSLPFKRVLTRRSPDEAPKKNGVPNSLEKLAAGRKEQERKHAEEQEARRKGEDVSSVSGQSKGEIEAQRKAAEWKSQKEEDIRRNQDKANKPAAQGKF